MDKFCCIFCFQQADEFGISETPLFPSVVNTNTQPQDGGSDSAAGQESQESVTFTNAIFFAILCIHALLVGTNMLVLEPWRCIWVFLLY